VISDFADFAIPFQQRLVQFTGSLNRLDKQRCSNAMQLRIGRVQHDEAVLGEQTREQLGVGSGQRLTFAITFAEVVRRQRLAEHFRCLCHQLIRPLSQADICDRRIRLPVGTCCKRHKLKIVAEQQRLIDLGKVVVFRRHPENRDAWNAGALHLLRQRQHRRSLEQRQERPAEQPNLLPGDYRKRASAQTSNIIQRLFRRSPRTVLLLQHICNFDVDLRAVRNRCAPLRNLRSIWRIGEELPDFGSVGKKIGEELGRMGNGTERDAVGDHARLSRQHRFAVFTFVIVSFALNRIRLAGR